jgi:hypothetical protein
MNRNKGSVSPEYAEITPSAKISGMFTVLSELPIFDCVGTFIPQAEINNNVK